ncbi:hypothetical protein HNR12_004176 [Streptomonospora nanhaiensis]|uniref:Uncharacterized protein n=1 Tax=Streptomonospora nanhaiensis TaxID=1323731 RepID=A0A853BQE2_9ACTN|nr:hypothetical protein [Streptomonospora nanhaiensis]NYI97899.1 hypothetical protein [Streptomonospora nanhaiensis]
MDSRSGAPAFPPAWSSFADYSGRDAYCSVFEGTKFAHLELGPRALADLNRLPPAARAEALTLITDLDLQAEEYNRRRAARIKSGGREWPWGRGWTYRSTPRRTFSDPDAGVGEIRLNHSVGTNGDGFQRVAVHDVGWKRGLDPLRDWRFEGERAHWLDRDVCATHTTFYEGAYFSNLELSPAAQRALDKAPESVRSGAVRALHELDQRIEQDNNRLLARSDGFVDAMPLYPSGVRWAQPPALKRNTPGNGGRPGHVEVGHRVGTHQIGLRRAVVEHITWRPHDTPALRRGRVKAAAPTARRGGGPGAPTTAALRRAAARFGPKRTA